MKIGLVSDTHGTRPSLPKADMLIHCGDLCPHGGRTDFLVQMAWLYSFRDKYKKGIYLCPGNHDIIIEDELAFAKEAAQSAKVKILIDEAIVIDGVKFYFSPWTPTFYRWAFMKDDTDLIPIWAQIPDDTQFLVTHGPAKHFLDWAPPDKSCGSQTLALRTYQLTDLKIHAFGHIHESYGTKRVDERFWAVNACSLDGHYCGFNRPFVVDTETWDVTNDSPLLERE